MAPRPKARKVSIPAGHFKRWIIPPGNPRTNILLGEMLREQEEMRADLKKLVGPTVGTKKWNIQIAKIAGIISAILGSGYIGANFPQWLSVIAWWL